MSRIRRDSLLLSAIACFLLASAVAEDSPSLGDVARQSRQHKSKDSPEPGAKKLKTITNDEIPEHVETASESNSENHGKLDSVSAPDGAKKPPEAWKAQIQTQKSVVGSLERDIARVSSSIQFAPANCVSGCVQWNERQKQKQQEVERLKSQLENQKKRLAAMQESARHQGYGSAVYDP